MSQIFEILLNSAVMPVNALKRHFLRHFLLKKSLISYKTRTKQKMKKVRHRFVEQTYGISDIQVSKRFDRWLSRLRSSSRVTPFSENRDFSDKREMYLKRVTY